MTHEKCLRKCINHGNCNECDIDCTQCADVKDDVVYSDGAIVSLTSFTDGTCNFTMQVLNNKVVSCNDFNENDDISIRNVDNVFSNESKTENMVFSNVNSDVNCDINSNVNNRDNDSHLIENRFYVFQNEQNIDDTGSDEIYTPSGQQPNHVQDDVSNCDYTHNTHKQFMECLSKIKGHSIACLNVRGLLNKFDQICNLIHECEFDLFGLCETFLDDSVYDYMYKIDGYNVFSKNRNRHGGGVLLYIKDNVKCEVIDLSVSQMIESIWVKVTLNSESYAIGVIYRPPSADRNYYKEILNQLDFIHANFEKVILMGDLNFDYKFDVSLSSNPVYNIECLYDMKQLITEPTRVTVTTSTLIDVILSNVSQLHVKSGVYQIGMSDHYLIFSVLKGTKMKSNHREITFRNYRKFNVNDFIYDLSECETLTDLEWTQNEFECKWVEFKEAFMKICNKHAPIQTRRLKDRKNPWVTPDILSMMYERDNLKKKAVMSKDPHIWSQYTSIRNKITQLLREAKKGFATTKLNEHGNDPRKMWKVLNNLTGRDKRKNMSSNVTAAKYNDFFNSIGTKTVSHLEPSTTGDIYWKCSKSIHKFNFQDISCESVRKLFMKLGNDSNVDVLGFDSKLLFHANDIISPIMCKFFNMSLRTNTVLQDWKLSRITPVYKGKGKYDEECNYRPLSVISHIAKIMEKLVQYQVVEFLLVHKLITTDQSAYIKYHNTQTSLHRVVDDFLWNMNDGDFTAVCALDISKCFDTIDHRILLKKLEYYGFNEASIKWFSSYLSHRGHKTFCNNEYSNVDYIDIGVPQGSVLGPTLFLLFINDINNYLGNATCNIYADDVLIYCNAPDVNSVNTKLQNSLLKIKEWYDRNMLHVNSTKTNSMLVTTKQREGRINRNSDAYLDLMLDNEKLCNVRDCKYLGVNIDVNLTWSTHIDSLCKELNSIVWTLSRMRTVIPFESLMTIYKSIMQPKIDYAITVWGYSSESNIDKVQRMQNRAVRAMLNNYDFINVRGIDLIKEMKILNIRQRRDYFMSVLMYKCIHGEAPTYLSNEIIMEIEVATRVTRNVNENNVYMPHVNLDITKSSFSYCGPLIWNSLTDDLKECTSLNVFKNKARNFWFNKVYI